MDEEIGYRTESGFMRARARRRLDLERIMRAYATASVLMINIQALNFVIMGALLLRLYVWIDKPVGAMGAVYVVTSFAVGRVGDWLWRARSLNH